MPLGDRGAGCSASCGGYGIEPTGQGAAFRQVEVTKIAVFTVVNALGVIVNRQGQVVRGGLDPETGERQSYTHYIERRIASREADKARQGNTTLTLVVTNQKLSSDALRQFARQVHSSMARAIQPFHTEDDGDVLFAATTNQKDSKMMRGETLGILASELAWDAVLSCFQDKEVKAP